MGSRLRGGGRKRGNLEYYGYFTLKAIWRKSMRNPLTACGAVEEFSGCRQVGCVQAIDLPGRRPFCLERCTQRAGRRRQRDGAQRPARAQCRGARSMSPGHGRYGSTDQSMGFSAAETQRRKPTAMMLDHLVGPAAPKTFPASPALAGALERAAASFARLDQALETHPLRAAFLYRVRLDAVRRQAAVDGQSIDPWHLAAVLEGLRLRMDGALRIIDRGAIFEAARHALTLHQWIAAPDFDQEGEVQIAEKALAHPSAAVAPLLSAAVSMHAWLRDGGTRPPIRAALIRHWTKHRLLRSLVPITGARALGAEVPFEAEVWIPLLLEALADEAADYLQLLTNMERVSFTARAAVVGRRSTSRAAAAVDVLAMAPLVSASTLAAGLGMAVKNAIALLADFAEAEIVVEVTHRSKRRLFGLAGLAPLRDEVAPPRRPEPGRGPGRPPAIREEKALPLPPLPDRPLTPIERKAIDYSELEHWMAHADQVIRDTRRTLEALVRGADPALLAAGGDGSVEVSPSTC
jgi:hypothetical protein